jgi:hypothetical protein
MNANLIHKWLRDSRFGPVAEASDAGRNVSTTLRQWHLDFKLDFLRLALVG